jgi:hypothetical protein
VRSFSVCNAVTWNPVIKNLFVTGLDKVRSDYSCVVWDINQSGAQSSESLHFGEPVCVKGGYQQNCRASQRLFFSMLQNVECDEG